MEIPSVTEDMRNWISQIFADWHIFHSGIHSALSYKAKHTLTLQYSHHTCQIKKTICSHYAE